MKNIFLAAMLSGSPLLVVATASMPAYACGGFLQPKCTTTLFVTVPAKPAPQPVKPVPQPVTGLKPVIPAQPQPGSSLISNTGNGVINGTGSGFILHNGSAFHN